VDSKRVPAEGWPALPGHEACGFALPGLAALLLLVAVGSVARSAAESNPTSPAEEPARRCGAVHDSRGESSPLDLEALARGYAALKSKLTFSLRESKFDPEKAIDQAFDLGVPACRGRSERRVPLKEPVPSNYRTSRLYFTRLGSRAPTSLPEAVLQNPETEVLLVSAESLRSVAGMSRELGKRVTLASPKLLEVLGIRCANTMVTFTEKGDEAILAEGD
jgi:hypothetical protein